MRGSEPKWADTGDHASLEEVFTSRSFGRPPPGVPARAIASESIAAPKLFGRNRFIAAGAVAAAALSVVAGLSIGSGPMAPPELSARSAGPVLPDFGTTPTTAAPSPASGGTPSDSVGAGSLEAGGQPSGASQASHGETPAPPVNAVLASNPSPQGASATPTVTAVRPATPPSTTITPPTSTPTPVPVSATAGGPAPAGGKGNGQGNGNGHGNGEGNNNGNGHNGSGKV
jgi:hypothetical protein